MREDRVAEVDGGGGTALWATGVEDEDPADGRITLDMVENKQNSNDVERVLFGLGS